MVLFVWMLRFGSGRLLRSSPVGRMMRRAPLSAGAAPLEEEEAEEAGVVFGEGGTKKEEGGGRLAYDHRYHAGSAVDCFKHVVLLALLKSMRAKAKPFTFVETHGGTGIYDLAGDEAVRLHESEAGIARLLLRAGAEDEDENEVVRGFVRSQRAARLTVSPDAYLGSAALGRLQLRKDDSLLAFERSEEVHALLVANLRRLEETTLLLSCPDTAAVDLRCGDGYRGLTAEARKPARPRALVLVDPPYQDGSDNDQVLRLVDHLRTHWRAARVAIWYPVSDTTDKPRSRLIDGFAGLDCDVLRCEFSIRPHQSGTDDEAPSHGSKATTTPRLPGSGIIVVQPPYKLDEDLADLLPRLGALLKHDDCDQVITKIDMINNSGASS